MLSTGLIQRSKIIKYHDCWVGGGDENELKTNSKKSSPSW